MPQVNGKKKHINICFPLELRLKKVKKNCVYKEKRTYNNRAKSKAKILRIKVC